MVTILGTEQELNGTDIRYYFIGYNNSNKMQTWEDKSFVPGVETMRRFWSSNEQPFIWGCLACISFQRSNSHLVYLPYTERNPLKLCKSRGRNHSSTAHRDINVMLRTASIWQNSPDTHKYSII
jgi:hypothetical protein